MSDRELLEDAAKAAGVALYWADDDPECDWVQGTYPRIPDYKVLEKWTWKVWNPITDDGDALRLMVRLAMTVRQEPSAVAAGWGADCLFGAPTVDGRGPWFWKEWLSDNQDPLAATRRAIVRAAAEIGRSKE